MRVPLSWLREYVDIQHTPEQLAERLTLLGMEVKGIEAWGGDWQHVVVGQLLKVERHPRADRLSLTLVDVGAGEPLEIVCGATNIAAGQRVPVALPGAVLPGDRRIERTEKMGVVSNGMLCSGDELELTGDGDGILILPPDSVIGRPLVELYGDTVLDLDVKPNRGDALCMFGLAREVAALSGAPIHFPDTTPPESADDPVTARLRVAVDEPALCPRFVARWISGVRVAPSPDDIQRRLRAAGQRPVSNVVDVSNYVMLELGKPIHTFDAAAVRGGRLTVRLARAGERLETLDHVQRELDRDTLVIAGDDGPLAIAGVMGSAGSEIAASTTDVVIESAIFDPVSIRRTAFRYALRSEASLRFEKGQEHRLARIGADRAARLIAAWAGGTVASGAIDSAPADVPLRQVAFRPARVERLLGSPIPTEDQRASLHTAGIETTVANGSAMVDIAARPLPRHVEAAPGTALEATIPTWRRDLEIEADVIEEIARLHGYDRIVGTLPDTPMPIYQPSPLRLRDTIRETLAGAGLHETVTSALVAPAMVERFAGPDDSRIAGEGLATGRPITVTNPLSSQHAVLRQNLLGSLLEVLATNIRQGRPGVAIFEIGKGYGAAEDGALTSDATTEWWRLAFALSGPALGPSWDQVGRDYDLGDGKGLVDLLARRLGRSDTTFAPLTDDPRLHPGRAAAVHVGDAIAGRVGELHPALLEALDLRTERVIVAELALAGLTAGSPFVAHGETPARQPQVGRDLAVVVDDARPAAEVAAAIRRHGGAELRVLELFDIYRGRPLAETDKSLAYRLTFQARDRTLTEAEIEAALAAIVDGLAADVGGRLRT